jgi:hypothetical protein
MVARSGVLRHDHGDWSRGSTRLGRVDGGIDEVGDEVIRGEEGDRSRPQALRREECDFGSVIKISTALDPRS